MLWNGADKKSSSATEEETLKTTRNIAIAILVFTILTFLMAGAILGIVVYEMFFIIDQYNISFTMRRWIEQFWRGFLKPAGTA